MKNKNVDPVYFNAMVGTWKSTTKTQSDLVFMKNCTYQRGKDIRGTVNGSVDEVTIDDDELDGLKLITGKIKLSIGKRNFDFKYRLIRNSGSEKRRWNFEEFYLIGGGKTHHFRFCDPALQNSGEKKAKSKRKPKVTA